MSVTRRPAWARRSAAPRPSAPPPRTPTVGACGSGLGRVIADDELPGEAAGGAAGVADQDLHGVRAGGVRLSICADASAPLTVSEAVWRSAPRPTSTADRVTGASAGTCPPALGAIVRTIGGAATADGEAIADGLGPTCWATPGEGAGNTRNRSASLGVSVGGTPSG